MKSFYETFVLKQTVVHLLNFCAKNPPLRQHPKRYVTFFQSERMIIKAEIISQPYSGEFKERIYDIESPWNSQNWTFIKFTENDYSDWCGQFRGFPESVQVSEKYQIVLVLSSDYLFVLDSITGDIIEFESQPKYKSLILTPNDDFLIADYNNIEKITSSLKNKKNIESINALLIQQGLSQADRLIELNKVAITQMKSLLQKRRY